MTPRRRRNFLTQTNFKLALGLGGAILIAAFFIYEFKFLRAPRLVITTPNQNETIITNTLEVKGLTDPDADLTLNGRPLYSGERGEFSDTTLLQEGTNTLVFEAKNRYGKTSTLTRYIVVQ
jgi:hypothetical protein